MEKDFNCNKGYCELGMREKEDALLLVVKVCPGQDPERGHWISLEGRIMYV